MVFGIGEGKLELALNGTAFSPGQAITGRATLSLNQPEQARELRVEFYGEIQMNRSPTSGFQHSSRKYTKRIFEAKQQLSGERTYSSGESFDISLPIPSISSNSPVPTEAPQFVRSLFDMFAPKPRWFVEATLDMPNKFDISKKIQIQLTKDGKEIGFDTRAFMSNPIDAPF